MSVELSLYCCPSVKPGLDLFCSPGNKSKKACKSNELTFKQFVTFTFVEL